MFGQCGVHVLGELIIFEQEDSTAHSNPSLSLHFSFYTVLITTAAWYYLSIDLRIFGCLPNESVKSKRPKPFLLLQLLKHVVVGAQ